jgi:uncharacterized protein (DUF362 family)/ferredoxin
MNPAHLVALQPCDSYELPAVRSAVRRCLDSVGDALSFLQAGAHILLKPNVVTPREPARAVCTHPAVVRAVAEVVLGAGCRVLVADQPTFGFARGREEILAPTGYFEALAGLPAEVTLLGRDGYEPVAVDYPRHLPTVHVSRLYRQVDGVINLPKCKTHTQTTLTLALKNPFGAVAPRDRLRVHALGGYYALAEALVDCYAATAPEFHLMDAVVAMEGPGPTQGRPRHMGLLAASRNAVAMDFVFEYLTGLMGQVGLTEVAARAGFGPRQIEDVPICGTDPADLQAPLRPPPIIGRSYPAALGRVGEKLLHVRPGIDRRRCIACGGCRQACPADGITIGRHATIDRDVCVECFCCMEACPVDAIHVDRGLLARLFRRS